jgi:hypothetical protein
MARRIDDIFRWRDLGAAMQSSEDPRGGIEQFRTIIERLGRRLAGAPEEEQQRIRNFFEALVASHLSRPGRGFRFED